ncbi:MAG: hypothetical protein M1820_006982 [Bogoriella megaspora]|nr:MAG: hypothetical protein M1820_006982 [Bogoriella megaspora]
MISTTIILTLFSFLSFTSSTPIHRRQSPLDPATTPFYLVTTTSPDAANKSSSLPNVNATSFYSPPPTSPTYNLRLIGPGYGSLPDFTLTNGVLSTLTTTPMGTGYAVYNSTATTSNTALAFAAADEGQGCLSLEGAGGIGKGGYLLAKDGETEGWTVCLDPVEEEPIIYWQGTDSSCKAVYLQAVVNPPY